MGAFFTNVQVFAGNVATDATRRKVVDAIRAWMLTLSFVEVESGGKCERALLVGPAGLQPWIAVYDEASEDQDIAPLDSLAAALSAALNATSVGILVHDSDVLALRLFCDGNKVDEFSNWPDYFDYGTSSRRRSASRKNHPERWRELLVAGESELALKSAWELRSEGNEAEAILNRMAPIVGWNSELVSIGLRSIPKSLLPSCTKLCFRQARPAVRRSVAPPALSHAGGAGPQVPAFVGQQVTLVTIAHNTGGASKGLRLVVWGPALEQGLVEPMSATVTLGSGENEFRLETTLDLGEGTTGKLGSADLPGVVIPEGISDPAAAFHASSGHYEEGMRAWLATRIHVSVMSTALNPGTADLHIGLVPAENPISGQTSWTIPHQIAASPRRPLCFVAGNEAYLEALVTPRTLVALAALGGDRAVSGRVGGDAFARWNTLINPSSSSTYTTMLVSKSGGATRTDRLPARQIPHGRRWRDLCSALEECQAFSATLVVGPPEGEVRSHRSHGFALYASQVLRLNRNGEVAPQLVLWMSLEQMNPQQISNASEKLIDIVDQAMAHAGGMQAFVARWGWSPADHVNLTPYEGACGLESGIIGRTWCSRYLRAVSETIWLGPAMLAHLGDTNALAAIADLTRTGESLRVSLRNEATLDKLEQALIPLLPTLEGWRRAVASNRDTTS